MILIVGIVFTFVQPLLQKDYQTAFWTLAGPIFFAIVALVFYQICFVELILIVGIVFTFVQPLLQKDYQTAFWTLAGPIFFAIVALVFYQISAKRHHVEG